MTAGSRKFGNFDNDSAVPSNRHENPSKWHRSTFVHISLGPPFQVLQAQAYIPTLSRNHHLRECPSGAFQVETKNTLTFARHSTPARVNPYTVHRTKRPSTGATDRCTVAEGGGPFIERTA